MGRAIDHARPVQVTELALVAEGVIAVKVIPLDGAPLPPWTPGAHVDLVLPNALTRQYSLVAAAQDLSWYQVAVGLDPASRGGSEYVHMFLRPGQRLTLGGPRNNFPLVPASFQVFVAGGIGVTGIVAMVRAVSESGGAADVHYAGRRLGAMAFTAELLSAAPQTRVYSREAGERLDLSKVLREAPAEAQIYCCGPSRMLQALHEEAATAGRSDTVHVERFKPVRQSGSQDEPVTVETRRSGVTVQVPADVSVLAGLERAGITLPSGCRNGLCGACAVSVISGCVDHRDDVLTSSQRAGQSIMLTCVSRSGSDQPLVLDV